MFNDPNLVLIAELGLLNAVIHRTSNTAPGSAYAATADKYPLKAVT
jgi:hypothetical protein